MSIDSIAVLLKPSVIKNVNDFVEIVFIAVLFKDKCSKLINGIVSRILIWELANLSTFKNPRPNVNNELNYELYAINSSKHFKLVPSRHVIDDSFKFNHLHKPKFFSSILFTFSNSLAGNLTTVPFTLKLVVLKAIP